LRPERQTIENPVAKKIAVTRERLSTFQNVDFQRTRFWTLCAYVATNYPRRLGPDASGYELSFDKQLSRRICSAYRTLWRLYSEDNNVPSPPNWDDWPINTVDPLANRIGATVIWDRQIDYSMIVVGRRMFSLSALQDLAEEDGLKRWVNKHDMLLEWEFQALERIRTWMLTKRPTVPGKALR
jgi:hypothetical protein